MRSGVLSNGHPVHYVLNYSATPVDVSYEMAQGKDLLSGATVAQNTKIALPAWGVAVIEENAR